MPLAVSTDTAMPERPAPAALAARAGETPPPATEEDGVIARQSAYTLIGRVVMAVCRGLGLVLISRAIGAAAFGEYSLVIASYAIASGLGTLGMDQAHVHFVGSGRRTLQSLLSNAMWTSLALGVAGGILLISCAHVLRGRIFDGTPWRALQITALVLPGVLFQNVLSGMTIGRAWFRYHGFVECGKWMLYLLLIGLFTARSELTITTALLALYLPIMLAGVVHVGALLSTYPGASWRTLFGRPEWDGLRQVTHFGARACSINVMHALHMRLDVYLIKYFLTSSAVVGQYALAVSITDVLLYLGRSVGLVLFAQRSAQPSFLSQAGPRAARVAAGVVLASALLLLGCAEPLVRVLFGPEFSAATGAVFARLPGLLAETVCFVLTGELLGVARMRPVFLATAAAVGFGLVLNCILVPIGGIIAAAGSFSLASWLRLGLVARAHGKEGGHSLAVYLRPSHGDVRSLWSRNAAAAAASEEVRS
jgi:O-antigen/teichoic acid export membrane protein